MKRYIATISGDETISFYNTVAALSPDPKYIPIWQGLHVFTQHSTKHFTTDYKITVSNEDLVILKLQFKTLKASAYE
jgi:hypothetical protein